MSGSKPLNSEDLRDNPVAIAKFLNRAFATNDLRSILYAINVAMRAQNVSALAGETGLHREQLYKTFGGEVDPQLGRVVKLFVGLGVRLAVKS